MAGTIVQGVTLKISKFKGMNNVKKAEGDNKEPTVILNSYVTPQGRVLKKTGHQPFATLSGAKNLFGGSVMLAVAGDRLYQIEGGLATISDRRWPGNRAMLDTDTCYRHELCRGE
jgi:hypothetical protein